MARKVDAVVEVIVEALAKAFRTKAAQDDRRESLQAGAVVGIDHEDIRRIARALRAAGMLKETKDG